MAYAYASGEWRFVNLNGAVGANEVGTGKIAENNPTDVMLVNHLLYWLSSKGESLQGKHSGIALITTQIKESQNWTAPGTITGLSEAIRLYQSDSNERFPYRTKLFVDGRVDRAVENANLTRVTHSEYTVNALLATYVAVKFKSGFLFGAAHYLMADPDCPEALKDELSESQVRLTSRRE